jgi:hypothetical protein
MNTGERTGYPEGLGILLITEAYVAVRYGDVPESPAELGRADCLGTFAKQS